MVTHVLITGLQFLGVVKARAGDQTTPFRVPFKGDESLVVSTNFAKASGRDPTRFARLGRDPCFLELTPRLDSVAMSLLFWRRVSGHGTECTHFLVAQIKIRAPRKFRVCSSTPATRPKSSRPPVTFSSNPSSGLLKGDPLSGLCGGHNKQMAVLARQTRSNEANWSDGRPPLVGLNRKPNGHRRDFEAHH